jgi:DNA-binding NarL/FixJ family response regulator
VKTRILIVHDAPLIRFALSGLIESSEAFAVCGQTDNAPTARDLFTTHSPAVVMLGLTLDRGDGVQLIRDFRKMDKRAATSAVSTREDAVSIKRAFRAGARGYLSARDSVTEVLAALADVLGGAVYVSTRMLSLVVSAFETEAMHSRSAEVSSLSDRELEIFSLVGRGFGVSKIATELNVSGKTIETHQDRIKKKLGSSTTSCMRAKAAKWISVSAHTKLQPRHRAPSGLHDR